MQSPNYTLRTTLHGSDRHIAQGPSLQVGTREGCTVIPQCERFGKGRARLDAPSQKGIGGFFLGTDWCKFHITVKSEKAEKKPKRFPLKQKPP